MTDIFIKWIDSGFEPRCKPNASFPDGRDVDMARGAREACLANLPYPAKRVGFYSIQCRTCNYSAVVTTAGRRDDPRSVKLPCKDRDGSK